MGFIGFVGRNVLPAILAGIGIVFLVLGYADQAKDILLFEPWQLQATGAAIILLAVGVLLYRWEKRHLAVTPTFADGPEAIRRRQLLDAARGLAARYASSSQPQEMSFREFLETTRTFASIRGYLSKDYRAKLNSSRVSYAKSDGARYEPLVEWFLDEIDRIERLWGLD